VEEYRYGRRFTEVRVYLLRRLISLIPVLIGVSVLVFVLVRLIPGDPIEIMLGELASPEIVQQTRQLYGLDKPIVIQYAIWVGQVLRGNLGVSLISKVPVLRLLRKHAEPTIIMTFGCILISTTVGITAGVIAALRRNRWQDYVASIFAFIGVSIPVFFTGILMILVFCVHLGWFPVAGYISLSNSLVESIHSMVLPWVTLGLAMAATTTRMMRSSLLEVYGKDYIVTARAKGVLELLVLYRHAFRNAMLPTITVVGVQFGQLLGGAVITETVFNIPGIGRLLVNAITQRDYPTIQGCILSITCVFVLVNLLTDLTYAYLDPRIRFE
jgi:peptide/nickel transport system permease protein